MTDWKGMTDEELLEAVNDPSIDEKPESDRMLAQLELCERFGWEFRSTDGNVVFPPKA